jgi:hypothetical protein
MVQKHTLNEHYKEIVRTVAGRLEAEEIIFDGSYEDQDDDMDINEVDIHGTVIRVTAVRVDGGKTTFDVTISDVEIEGGTE